MRYLLAVLLGACVSATAQEVRLVTLDPGHFHAALVQKQMPPGVSETVHVYAPLGPDLLAHLGRVAAFNGRPEDPTRWRLEVHAGGDSLARMLRDKPGNVVVLSGRNRGKIDSVLASVEAGLHVLADKPWLIAAADLPRLEQALDTAQRRGLVAYDVMTERYEITTILQRALANAPEVVGTIPAGSEREPAIELESVHHLMKVVAGAVNLRPAWFFDTEQQGEGLARRGDAPGGPRALAALPGAGDRPSVAAAGALGASLADRARSRAAAAASGRAGAAGVAGRGPPGREARLLRERGGVVHAPRRPRAAARAVELRGTRGRRRHAPRARAGQPRPARGAAGRRAGLAAGAVRRAGPAGGCHGAAHSARAAGRSARRHAARPGGRGRRRALAGGDSRPLPPRPRGPLRRGHRELPRLREGSGARCPRGRRPTCWRSTS